LFNFLDVFAKICLARPKMIRAHLFRPAKRLLGSSGKRPGKEGGESERERKRG